MKTINVDADPKNANWAKRTKDVTDYPLAPVDGKKVKVSKSVAKSVRSKGA